MRDGTGSPGAHSFVSARTALCNHRTTLRTGLVIGLVAAALVSAAQAAARTQLLVSGPTANAASGMTTIEVRGAAADGAWAEIATFVPNGYTVNLGHPTGTRIGSVAARAQLLETSADVTASGTIAVADRNDPQVQQAANACTNDRAHSAVWLVQLTASGRSVAAYVFVDPTSGGEQLFGSATLVLCLPQPYASVLPDYSPLGLKLSDLTLTLTAGVFTNPLFAGSNLWRAVLTPWSADGTGPNLAGTTESQAIVGLPSSLQLHAKVERNSLLLSGSLLEDGQGIAGAKVAFFANDVSAGGAATTARGTFANRRRLTARAAYTATATVPKRTTSCVTPLPTVLAPAGCVSATTGGYRLRSNAVVVAPRAR